MLINSVNDWAIETFGACDLDDKRRTQRLFKVASSLASHIGQSLVKSCGSTAEIEGAYRLLRNDQVDCDAIAESGFKANAQQAWSSKTLLALEDSTSLSFDHSVREALGPVGCESNSRHQGFNGAFDIIGGCRYSAHGRTDRAAPLDKER
jgi:hypothetical protein